MRFAQKIGLVLLSFILLSFYGILTVSADSNGIPFIVEPILPDNQDEVVNSYISIISDSNNLNQNIEFKVTNESEIEQNIYIKVVDAYTSPNGVIQYVEEESDNSTITNDNYKLSKHLTLPENQVTLKPGETKIITSSLDVNDLEGTLLGGVSFSTTGKSEEYEKNDTSFKINNEINMVIGVMVTFKNQTEIDFTIDEPYLDPMPSYYAIRLPISLDAPLLVNGTEIKYIVKHNDKELFSGQKEFSFAPLTKVNMAIPFEYEEIINNEIYDVLGEIIYID